MPRIALPAAALAALTAPALASIPEVLVAETTRSFSYNDAAGFEITSINTFLSINEIPLGDISEIFEDIFILRSVTEASTGAVYVADLTSPALAGPLALLTNGTDDEIWYGGDSDGGGDYRSVTEAALFTGAVGPDGNPITGPDLAGFTPTRAELQIDSLSINWDGSFDTAVSATVTFRFFAEAEPSTALDVGNAEFWDLIADPDNESRTYDLAAALGFPSGSPLLLDSIQWDVVLTTIGASWGSEAQIGFDFDLDGAFELFLTPGVGDDLPVTDQAYSSGGAVFFADLGLPDQFSPDGLVRLEFYETFDDVPNAVDAFFGPGDAVAFTGLTRCNPADLAPPFGTLDLGDITAFISAFGAQDPTADLAPPAGIFDLADVLAFVDSFNAGCP